MSNKLEELCKCSPPCSSGCKDPFVKVPLSDGKVWITPIDNLTLRDCVWELAQRAEKAEAERDELKRRVDELEAIVNYFIDDDEVRSLFGFRLTPEELLELAKNQVAMMTQTKVKITLVEQI